MNKIVNTYYFNAFLDPLTGSADSNIETEFYNGIDPNDEMAVKQVIRERIQPYIQGFDEKRREAAKLGLRYYLSQVDSANPYYADLFQGNLIALELPDNPRQFFVWIWEELFNGEDSRLPDLHEYVERPSSGL